MFFASKERESHRALSLQASKGYAGNLAAQLFRMRNYAVRGKRIASLIAETNINVSNVLTEHE
jgi:hypothetical protein